MVIHELVVLIAVSLTAAGLPNCSYKSDWWFYTKQIIITNSYSSISIRIQNIGNLTRLQDLYHSADVKNLIVMTLLCHKT